MHGAPGPLVIFATGGSGTRALATVARRAGYFMGSNPNRAGDSTDVARFLARWLANYLTSSGWLDDAARGRAVERDARLDPAMVEDFRETIEAHRAEQPRSEPRWGWKAPRTMFVLPFVDAVQPGVRFVHLIRDGRDMAYSGNQRQLRGQGERVLEASDLELPRPVQSITLWARANLAAARYGERHMGDRYLRLEFERLCSEPEATLSRFLGFLGDEESSGMNASALADELIEAPPSIGRWREQPSDEVARVEQAGAEALRELGYG